MVEQHIVIDQLKLKLEKFTEVKALDFPTAYKDGPAGPSLVMAFARRGYGIPVTKNLPSETVSQKVRSTQIFPLLLCND